MTADWIAFEGRIMPMVWGRATYTVLPLPATVVAALGPARRVEGEIADHPVNLAVTRAPVAAGPFLWAGQSLINRIGVAPGDLLDVRLRPAPDDRVDLPDDVAAAIRTAGQAEAWQALTPGRQRGLLYPVDSAKTPPTRDRRITALVAALADGSAAAPRQRRRP
jgi:hypothetical protein